MYHLFGRFMLVTVGVAGCQALPSDTGPAISDTVFVEGMRYTASIDDRKDSLRATVEILNTRHDSATLKVGGCPVTLQAYASAPHLGQEPVWDERKRIDCVSLESWIQLAPGQLEVLSHTISKYGGFQRENPIPVGRHHFVLRIDRRLPVLVLAGEAVVGER